MNKVTGKPKGTAFVEFETPEGSLKAAAACQAQRDGKGEGVALMGKMLAIDTALVQDAARVLAQEQSGFTGKSKDSRNLYLVRYPPATCSLCCAVLPHSKLVSYTAVWLGIKL
jgi:nucleolar protein 4